MGAFKRGARVGKLAGLALVGVLAVSAFGAAPAQAATPSVTVKGHVRTPGGDAIKTAQVSVYYRTPSVGQELVKRTYVSSTGRYELKVPKSYDTYRIKVTDPGDRDRDTADGKWAPSLSARFRSDAKTLTRNITLQPGAKLSGRIYERGGKPVAAGLEVHVSGKSVIGDAKTYTREGGAYYFSNLPSGEVNVLVASPSPNGSARWYRVNDSSGSIADTGASDVAVSPAKKATGISIYFPVVSKITGRVTVDGTQPFGEGGRYVSTVLYDGDGKRVGSYFTNPTFYFRDLPAGTYYLGFESSEGADPIVSEYYADEATLAEATPITVKAGGAVSGIVARLQSASAR